MPLWLRKFTFEKLKEYYEKQKEEAENQQNILKNRSGKEVLRPDLAPSKPPTYVAKAPKK
jgi:hypothetical protein